MLMDYEVLIKQKNEEIKKLHEVYDVENIMKMVETLNDENDKLYNELMMLKNQMYIVKSRFNSYKHNVKSVLDILKKYFNQTHGEEHLGTSLLKWITDIDSDSDDNDED